MAKDKDKDKAGRREPSKLGDRERREKQRRSGKARRRSCVDRRGGLDRRRGPGRRRTEARRAAEEGEMTAEQFDFLKAINEYKSVNKRPFPTWTEVLDVMKALGYRKVAESSDIRHADSE
ncbi:MAG: hypothetical protein ISS78_03835 [Phycisphaerae bacterium]|nr:hypothetical protein [Phycisphaerae bacterium]